MYTEDKRESWTKIEIYKYVFYDIKKNLNDLFLNEVLRKNKREVKETGKNKRKRAQSVGRWSKL